ncbi:class I SAM-dependent rRNA methyltransferase [Deinococcus detaillensis]|uniref:Class I SAM-dependent rRNA methyltransferase n=1 Tax=Deinococcus detaillensis TaxID=2592048 RepID=A0A553USL9_9DEIO|nr:class I SAM-dependent rRNA methyltransferase [Deinococcus detaillensis]TSA83001.1 class I SAM-dependent rRNA methyltransferase [Deinococcus detaillensis]
MNVKIKTQALRRLRGRYPFGHTGDIASADAGITAGEVVDVLTEEGRFVGRGYFNAAGATPLRMLTLQREDINEAFYRRRIREALQRRENQIHRTDALRVIHAEADGLPGVVADQFGSSSSGGVLAVQLRNAGTERHRDLILSALKKETGAAAAYERSDTGERRREGLDLKTGELWGEVPARVNFVEDDLELFFEWRTAQKTGFFLDQRDNRRMMAELVRPGQNFLDVYSYTGGFSLQAAKRGATTLAVDKDVAALATLEAVARANKLKAGARLGDALEVLSQLEREKRRFDAVVLDPPTLAKRRDDVPNAKRIFTAAATSALKMLNPGGHLLISTCAHYLRVDDLLDAARVAAGEAEAAAQVVAITYQPADHPYMLAVPESLYLKSVLLKKE